MWQNGAGRTSAVDGVRGADALPIGNIGVRHRRSAARDKASQRLAAAKREVDRVVNGYVRGVVSESDALRVLPDLCAEVATLEARLATLPAPPK